MQETDLELQSFNDNIERLTEDLLKVASEDDLKTFKILNLTYHSTPELWGLQHGENFVFETQTGYSKYKSNKLLKAILLVLDRYHEEVVLHYLGYK